MGCPSFDLPHHDDADQEEQRPEDRNEKPGRGGGAELAGEDAYKPAFWRRRRDRVPGDVCDRKARFDRQIDEGE